MTQGIPAFERSETLVGWFDGYRRFRLASWIGVAALTAVAVTVSSTLVASLGLDAGSSPATATTVVVVLAVTVALRPLFVLRPWRTLHHLKSVFSRVAIAIVSVGVAGFLGVSFVPSPIVLVTIGGILVPGVAISLPVLRSLCRENRAVVVGNDPEKIETAVTEVGTPLIGYLSPDETGLGNPERRAATSPEHRRPIPPKPMAVAGAPGKDTSGATGGTVRSDTAETSAPETSENTDRVEPAADGGTVTATGVPRLGSPSRLETKLLEYDVDTVAVAFRDADREALFGALRACHDVGVDVRAHESHADSVLTTDHRSERSGTLVDVDIEPWPWYSRLAKRAFDVCFAVVGLVVLLPLILVIGSVIKLDSTGSIIYEQRRTAELGGTFTLLKFRTMLPESEYSGLQYDAKNGRITRVGKVLRETHLDEIPQLLSILWGEMSVVGPRAVWIEEDRLLQQRIDGWSQRWAVKPGLTGLAQVRDAKSSEGERKFACDIEYIDRQSLAFDLFLVVRQIWLIITHLADLTVQQLKRIRTGRES